MNKQTVESLNNQIIAARDAYYRGNPVLTDNEYDVLEAELRGIVLSNSDLRPIATALDTVGDVRAGGGRYKHARPMLSIENQYTIEGVQKFFSTNLSVVVEPKRDGLSVELNYGKNGNLIQALTRGDGESGEDITEQIRVCKAIPQQLCLPKLSGSNTVGNLRIRGELLISKSTFARINRELAALGKKEYSSPRNLAVGTTKLHDLAEVTKRHLEIRVWDVYSPDENHPYLSSSYRHNMDFLMNWFIWEGTEVSHEAIEEAIQVCLEANEKSDYVSDGVVIKINNLDARKKLGEGRNTTNWQTCFKSQNSGATTHLRNVVWQMGRQGKLTPVGIVDPVNLAGARIERVMLNNLSWIQGMGIQLNSEVEVLRSGEIIPVITKVYPWNGIGIKPTSITAPYVCPECNTRITIEKTKEITTHWCESVNCPGRLRDYFTFVAGRGILEIDALGPEMANWLVSDGYALNIADLFEFGNELSGKITQYGEAKIAKTMGAAVVKMAKSLENAKTADWDRWIAALGIPLVSMTLGKILAIQLELKSEGMLGLTRDFAAAAREGKIEGAGVKKLEFISEWAGNQANLELVTRLYLAGVRPKPLAKKIALAGNLPLSDVKFVITGEFNQSRDIITQKLVSLGAEAKSGVSTKVNLLVVGTSPGGSKLKAAERNNIKKVDAIWLSQTFKSNNVEWDDSEEVVDALEF